MNRIRTGEQNRYANQYESLLRCTGFFAVRTAAEQRVCRCDYAERRRAARYESQHKRLMLA